MRRNLITLPLLALFAILTAAPAMAGEALPELKGSWLAESLDGEAPPPGVSMKMTFIDDAKLKMEVTFQGETKLEEVKYEATKEGKITIYPEPDTNPAGEKATWEIKDKKLVLTTEDNEVLIFKRPE